MRLVHERRSKLDTDDNVAAKNLVASGGDIAYIDNWTERARFVQALARSAIMNDVWLMLYVIHV